MCFYVTLFLLHRGTVISIAREYTSPKVKNESQRNMLKSKEANAKSP